MPNLFPSHWNNRTSYEVKTCLNLKYPMIHSMNSSEIEDYWYANQTCQIDSGKL